MQSLRAKSRFLGAITALVFQMSLFLFAFIAPQYNINFIYKVGPLIFVLEFLSIHSSFLLFDSRKSFIKYALVFLYIGFAIAFSIGTSSYTPAALFIAGLFARLLYPSGSSKVNLIPILVLFISLFTVIFASPLFHNMLALSQDITSQKPQNVSGLFIEKPETLLAWGVLYYGLLIVSEIWRFRRQGTLPPFLEASFTDRLNR